MNKMPTISTQAKYDQEFPNVFEKFLRSRLSYAVLSATLAPPTPGFIDAVVTGGSCKYQTASNIRDELWVKNKYPHSEFFCHKVVKYKYPPQVTEILDLRFSRDPLNKPRADVAPLVNNPVYQVSLHELATIPSWGPPTIAPEHMPRYQDTPLLDPHDLQPICCKQSRCTSGYCKPSYPGPAIQYGRSNSCSQRM